MKKLLIVVICLGVSLTIAGDAEAASERRTVNVFAVCANSEIKIIKGEGFHDTAVMGRGTLEKISWNLDCLNCEEIQGGPDNKAQTCGGNIVEYWIQSVEFAADLDDAAERIASGDVTVEVKKTRKNNGVGLMNPADFVGTNKDAAAANPRRRKARKKSENKHLESISLDSDFPDDLHELWKFTIVATAYPDPLPPNALIIDETNFEGMRAVCEALIECDYWDPHIYVHGDGRPGI